MQESFPNGIDSALVAVRANIDSPATQHAFDELKAKALASGQMHGPIEVDVNPSHTVAASRSRSRAKARTPRRRTR